MRGRIAGQYMGNGRGVEQYLRSSDVTFKDFREHVPEVSRG
jgi:hypothetical protein